ncbi:M23 family metallopeptidase [Nocardioidaceae bacterium]|nr:M23 family metallopeptidase [Nocardioidaceae bacterium]
MTAFDPPSSLFGAGHRGVDLAGAAGQPVLAPLAGTVTTAGSIAGTPVVVVSHGETRTTYQPVRAAVAVGEDVTPGQVIGHLSAEGSHCPPGVCLHWGLKRDEEYLDPMDLLGARRVRLLPADDAQARG